MSNDADAKDSTEVAAAPDQNDILDERLIDAEYKIWKKNTPYLYDFVLTHSLEWPSLTCQWLPIARAKGTTSIEHQVLIGTHTTENEPNYLMIASCQLPYDDAVVPNSTEDTTTAESNGKDTVASLRYDEEKKEVGGYGLAGAGVGKIEIKMKIQHEGEVNRARYMPQNHFIVASRGPHPDIYIWDISKHSSFPDEKTPVVLSSPQGVCVGHSKEGYAMAWSPHQSGLLLTGSEDGTVQLWDVTAACASKTRINQISPQATFAMHTATVEDVAWHGKDPNMMGSVGDDRRICIWDTRTEVTKVPIHNIVDAHDGDINCIAFNPFMEYVLATGCADSTIAVWDLRNMSKPISQLLGHTDQVFKVEWSPFNESILGSCSADRRVALWDLSRIGQEQSPEDAEDGPPELLFLHGGHTSNVSDFSWNAKDEWSIVSVSEDNVLQVWKPAEEIYAEDGDDEEDDEQGDAVKGKGDIQDDDLE